MRTPASPAHLKAQLLPRVESNIHYRSKHRPPPALVSLLLGQVIARDLMPLTLWQYPPPRVNPPPPRLSRKQACVGWSPCRDAPDLPLPPHPCPAPLSPVTANLLFTTRARRVAPLFRRSGGQRADSMLRRQSVRAGMLFLLSSGLPPARASVPEGGVLGAK